MIAAVLLLCVASLTPTTLAAEGGVAAFQSTPGGCISLADCGEMGPLHINGAVGSASRTVIDSTRKMQALRFSYTLAPGAIGGIWTKAYPAEVNADTADTLAVSAIAGSAEQAKDVDVTVELKGTTGQQVLHLGVGTTLALNRQILDWEAIGEFREMVLLVHHAAGAKAVAGHVDFCAEFSALPVMTSLAMVGSGRLKVLGILVVIAAILAGLWGAVSKPSQPKHERSSGIRADLFIGFNALLVIAMAILTYSIGDIPAIEVGSTCFIVIILGGIVSAAMRRGLTGQALTVGEAFRDTLFPGLLAVSATSIPIWSAPQTWSDLGEVSSLGAATFISLYHVVNAYCLNVRRRHLSFFGGMLLIAVPYAFGLLLALQNLALFSTIVTVREGWQTTLLHSAGAVVLIFVFVEFASQAFSLVTRQYFMHDWVAQKHILRMSAAVVVAPFIADLGSGEWAASLPWLVRPLLAVATTVLSQGALWAVTFAVTGMVLDAFRDEEPNHWRILANARKGMVNGMVYSGVLMAILQILSLILRFEWPQSLFLNCRLPAMALGGALVFPLLKTIIETFDGSVAFFARARQSYHRPLLYVRGLVVGAAASMGLNMHFVDLPTDQRALFGLLVGIGALAGVTLLHDVISPAWGGEGRQSWRVYSCQSLLGGFVGAAMGFYLDASQVPVIIERFTDYTSFGHAARPDDCYPLLSKWGRIAVGSYTGGARLLFNQALKGVIGWGVAAWLFALNKSLLNAVFERDFSHIRRLASREGLAELGQGSIRVLRWGLWMAPVIFTFLRQAETPTWYNQDGAIRTAACIYSSMTMSPQGFQNWSLQLFTRMLGYDYLRILIWLDHMGLRVATLVNISFIGLERLDGKITRFAGPVDGGPGFIPEAVKRFTTWAPLLLPFYIPRGPHWDYAWDTSQRMQAAQSGWVATLLRQPPETLAVASVATFVGVVLSLSVARFWRERGTRVRGNAVNLSGQNAMAPVAAQAVSAILAVSQVGAEQCKPASKE
ncbi:MAG: hypothetical protein HN742_19420 [Lentisphaerae bacterium]|nr:hypothetical protein [Lentisphaerota bacterium]MBT7055423.1 hypothetical protein [Lentisphaerota bacterium]MBT7844059.1 hypothetical protein [Lentisphaerota bacterium]